MSDDVKKIAIPTLGGMWIGALILRKFGVEVDPATMNTILGLFAASVGFPLIGSIAGALNIKINRG